MQTPLPSLLLPFRNIRPVKLIYLFISSSSFQSATQLCSSVRYKADLVERRARSRSSLPVFMSQVGDGSLHYLRAPPSLPLPRKCHSASRYPSLCLPPPLPHTATNIHSGLQYISNPACSVLAAHCRHGYRLLKPSGYRISC